MRVVYIADDGMEFDNEFDCMDYEWKISHSLDDICFYDKNNNILTDIFSEDTYENTERVVVLNEASLKDLQEFAEYTGYCCYYGIDECGEWIFDSTKCGFVKV